MPSNNETEQDLHVVVFAGPNGSGKTSLIDEIKETGLATVRGVYPLPAYFINPDQVAKDLVGAYQDQGERDVAAQSAAMRIRAEAIAKKLPFAFETVMSHPSRINEMLSLKEQGYRLFLTFITTDDPEKNVERVRMRYVTNTTTGHYVAPEKVRERYHRTLALLPRAAEVADAVYVYDNSADYKKPSLQAVIELGSQYSIAEDAKRWVIERLVRPLQYREEEVGEFVMELESQGFEIGETDELRGAYTGPVERVGSHFLAQRDEASGLVLIHDRLMLDTARADLVEYKVGLHLSVAYSPLNAPVLSYPAPAPAAIEAHPRVKRQAPRGG